MIKAGPESDRATVPPPAAQLAAAAWRLRAGELWQGRHAGDAPAQRLAALAGLVVKLEDATEIEFRRRNLQSLDPAQERSVSVAAA